MEALDVGAPRQTLRNLLPVLAVELQHRLGQLLVLLRRPVSLVRAVLVLGRPRFVDCRVRCLACDDHLLRHLVKFLLVWARVEEHARHQRRLVHRQTRYTAADT